MSFGFFELIYNQQVAMFFEKYMNFIFLPDVVFYQMFQLPYVLSYREEANNWCYLLQNGNIEELCVTFNPHALPQTL